MKTDQKMCLRSHIINGFLTSFCSVWTGKYLDSVYPHSPRSFVARSVRKPQVNLRRGCIFHETFVRHHSDQTKYIIFIVFLWLMIKTKNICVFVSSNIKIQKCVKDKSEKNKTVCAETIPVTTKNFAQMRNTMKISKFSVLYFN
jgi:hypothetical protein